jgi:hypothetical protein
MSNEFAKFLAELEHLCYTVFMISGKPNQQPSSQRTVICPQQMRHQWSKYSAQKLLNDSMNLSLNLAVLVHFPVHQNMPVLPSRATLPGPFPTSFTTGTTLPPQPDPSTLISALADSPGFPPSNGLNSGALSPQKTADRDGHVFLL